MSKLIETRPIKDDRYKLSPSCTTCFGDASFEALFELEDAIVIKRYCEECLSKGVLED